MGTCKLIKGKRLQQLFSRKISQVAQLFSIEAKEETEYYDGEEGKCTVISNKQPQVSWQVHKLALFDVLLVEYQDLFIEPKSLPPERSLDHSIPL